MRRSFRELILVATAIFVCTSTQAAGNDLNDAQLKALFSGGLSFRFDGRNNTIDFRFKDNGKWYAESPGAEEAWGDWWIAGDKLCNDVDGPDRGWKTFREKEDCAIISVNGGQLYWSKFPKALILGDSSVLARIPAEGGQSKAVAEVPAKDRFIQLSGKQIASLFSGGLSFQWNGENATVFYQYLDDGTWSARKPDGGTTGGRWEVKGDMHCRTIEGSTSGWRTMASRPNCNPVFRREREIFYGADYQPLQLHDTDQAFARVMPNAAAPTGNTATADAGIAREKEQLWQQAELERQKIEAEKRELELMRLALERERLQQQQLALQQQQQALRPVAPPPVEPDTAPPVISAAKTMETKSESLTIDGTVRDDRKLTRIEVDGAEVPFHGRDGSFSVTRPVGMGQSRIRIAAFDGEGNKAEHVILVTRLRDIPPVAFGKYHALVIGINDYDALPKLQTAVNDARAVAKALKEEYGFSVKLMENASRGDIIDALDEYRDSLEDQDNLLIYYAGHGWLDQETGRGYWLPAGSKADRRSNWFSNASLTDALQALHAKHVMVVADSCYSGTLTRSLTVPPTRNPDYISRMAEKRTRVVLASGGLEPVADSGSRGHSVFAAQFLRALKENQGVLDGTQLFEHVRHSVVLNANQTPQYSDIRLAGHEGGDFLFVRKD